MERKTFFSYFVKLYFLNLKQKVNANLDNFRNIKKHGDNSVYTDFFTKINKIKSIFRVGVSNNLRQRGRIFGVLRKFVSIHKYNIK